MRKNLIYKTFGVYQIKNLINGKVKVGSTIRSFSERWAEWRRDLKQGKSNDHLQKSWDKTPHHWLQIKKEQKTIGL